MARKLKDFEFTQENAKYPWDEWLDGDIWELTPGKDFPVKINTFRPAAFSAAKNRGLKIRTKQRNGKLIIQAYNPTSPKK